MHIIHLSIVSIRLIPGKNRLSKNHSQWIEHRPHPLESVHIAKWYFPAYLARCALSLQYTPDLISAQGKPLLYPSEQGDQAFCECDDDNPPDSSTSNSIDADKPIPTCEIGSGCSCVETSGTIFYFPSTINENTQFKYSVKPIL